jgi:hypothetical protein
MPEGMTMKGLRGLVLLVLVGFAPVGMAAGQSKSRAGRGVEGHWAGPLKVTIRGELQITLAVTKGKDGSLSGTWGSPDEALKDLPLESIEFNEGALTFTTKHGAIYKGKLNRPGTEIVGQWTHRGKTIPLNFKRFDPSKVVVAPIPKELEGIWEGKLKLNGGIELRLALKVQKTGEGALKATLASPDQGANNIPVGSVGLKDDVLTFESKIIGAKFTGKRSKDGMAFEGQFEQTGAKFPLTLKAEEDGQAQ